jgi:hypothetical protein
MRIAVCISGQPRTIKYTINSIKNFFSTNYQYDFFCHAWDYNEYKVKDIGFPIQFNTSSTTEEEFRDIISQLSPKKVVVESKDVLANIHFPWHSLLYSAMMANLYKKQYEIEHNFNYDFVVKSRYDLVFPATQFMLDQRVTSSIHHPLNLYTAHCDRMALEYYRQNISDVIYYGSSWAMDVASDLFWYSLSKAKVKPDDICNLGPGTLMAEYIRTTGLLFQRTHLPEIIYRESAIPLSPETDLDKIIQHHADIYK